MPTLSPLRDCLRPGIRVLFVGINPGMRSAATGHHFAGYSNRFWKLLFEARLVPERLTFEEDRRLPEFGFGITNLVARPTPGIGDLAPAEYESGRRRLLAKVRRYRPAVVVLVGVTLYRALIGTQRTSTRLADVESADVESGLSRTRSADVESADVESGFSRTRSPVDVESGFSRTRRASRPLPQPLGLRAETLGGAPVFVLPNPSGRNANYSYAEMLEAFEALRELLARHPGD